MMVITSSIKQYYNHFLRNTLGIPQKTQVLLFISSHHHYNLYNAQIFCTLQLKLNVESHTSHYERFRKLIC